jgi:hypothetical protein
MHGAPPPASAICLSHIRKATTHDEGIYTHLIYTSATAESKDKNPFNPKDMSPADRMKFVELLKGKI